MILLLLFLEFFKIGCFSFGGGFGMLPLMEQTVLDHGWLTESQFYDFVGVCESTPGPIAVNMATYVGSCQAGIAGSIAATLGVVLPSFLIILLIAAVMKKFCDHPYVRSFIKGVQPVIIGLILSTGVQLLVKATGLGQSSAFSFPAVLSLIGVAGAALIFRLFTGKKLTAVPLIGLAAAMGVAFSFF